MQKITPFLWFDTNAEEAVNFYTSIFNNSKIGKMARYDEASAKVSGMPQGSVMVIDFEIEGQNFSALNGGPVFKFNPSISFFVYCKTEKQVDEMFNKLSKDGQVMMALDKYPFSERYGWTADKFGVSWQIMLAPDKSGIVPCFLFVKESLGKAEAAVNFYTSIFKNAKINQMKIYAENEGGKPGTVMFSSFNLENQEFSAMDGEGSHEFAFNSAISFVVDCVDQEEVDHYWNKLTAGGKEVQCGWLEDKFGVSWQIVPSRLNEMLSDKDPKKAEKAMKAMLQMVKLDINELEKAYNG